MSTEPVHRRQLGLPAPLRVHMRKGHEESSSPSRDGGMAGPPRSGVTARLFVGRERELFELEAGLDEARSGCGSLFLLSGEPGIGKTRLAKEAGDLAARREARVLWGHAWEGGGQPAYWPWVQILRAYVRSEDPAVLAADLHGDPSYIGQLVPELHALLPDAQDGSAAVRVDSDHARFYLFDSVAEFLRSGAARRPLVIVLDDLHAADLSTLLLLQFLAAELHETRILAIATYRGGDARRSPEVASRVADLARGNRRLALGGLAERDIARLIEQSAGIVPSAELVSAVHRVTEGNPFFADEIVRILAAEGRLQSPDALGARLRLPDGVREAIRRRLAPLPVKCQEILTLAAVVDHEFDARLLQAVSDRSMEQVIEVLDDAVAAGIVEQVSPPFGRFRFSHALIRETLYEDLSSVRRQLLHRNIGETLERIYAGNLDRHIATLAHQFCQAAPAGVGEKAIDYAVRAGRRAMHLLAYEEAVGHFELALHTLDVVGDPRDDLRCELLLGLGTAQGAAGGRRNSQEAFMQAAEAARAAGHAEKFADAVLGLGRQDAFHDAFETPRNPDHPLVHLVEEALAALPLEDSPLRARLLSRLASAIFWKAGTYELRRSLVLEAVEMAERLGDSSALAEALTNKRMALMGPDGAAERLADATRVLRLAVETGDREREIQAREARLFDLLELGDVAAADVEIERIEQLARVLRQARFLADAEMVRALRTLMDGKLDEGAELARRARALNEQVRPETAATLYGSQMFRAVWGERGRLADLESGMKSIFDYAGAMPGTISGLAYLRTEQGKRDEAQAEFDLIAADDFAGISRESAWTSVMGNLTEVCCFLGDAARARVLYEKLLPFGAMNIVLGALPHACSQRRWEKSAERPSTSSWRSRWRRGCACRRPARTRSVNSVACSCAAIARTTPRAVRTSWPARSRPPARSGCRFSRRR
jgi:AAA ATPase domain